MRGYGLTFLIVGLTMILSACGQSGSLMLPSDPNYDKRPSYLIYKKNKQQTQQPVEEQHNTNNE